MNELMKFHKLFMCGGHCCDSPGSTQTLGKVTQQPRRWHRSPACPSHTVWAVLQEPPGQSHSPGDLRAALLTALTRAMALCCHLGKLEEQTLAVHGINASKVPALRGTHTVLPSKWQFKASMVNPHLYIQKDTYWDEDIEASLLSL